MPSKPGLRSFSLSATAFTCNQCKLAGQPYLRRFQCAACGGEIHDDCGTLGETLSSAAHVHPLYATAFAVAGVMLRHTRLGRALYAIGGNSEAARAAGIRVERVTWGVYVLAGLLAAVGGLVITGYVGAISANQGNGMIFTVFAAAVIGGISLDGGKGTMLGALTGVLLLGVVQNLLTLAQVPSFWIQAIYGAIILGSLMIARLTSGTAQT